MPDKNIDRNRPKKLYIQVFDAIREEIESGKWPVGSQIPIEDELCRKYQVSKATIRLGILELVRQGFLTRYQGKGTFVCPRTPSAGVAMSMEFNEFMIEPAAGLSTRVLAQTMMTPVDDLESQLDAPGEQHVIYIRRLLLADAEPVLLAESYVPHRICPGLLREDIEGGILSEILEKKFNIPITRVRNLFDVAQASETEGKLLDLSKGAPLLLLEQHFYSQAAQVMYMRTVKRTDKLRFVLELEKRF